MRKNTALKLTPVEPLAEPNPLVVVGSNSEPMGIEPTPYEAAKKRIDDLFEEAKLWLDGAVVDNADLADGIKNLRDEINKAHKAADEARKAENKTFDDGKAEVQERYNALIGKTTKVTGLTLKVLDAINKGLEPWLLAEDKRIKDEAAAARKIADEAAAKAQEALRASHPSNLAGREEAEVLLTEAKALNIDANHAGKAKASVSGNFGNRSISLRKVYKAEFNPASEDGKIEDGRILALRHFCKKNPREVSEFIQGLADASIRFGDHIPDEIPGMTISFDMKL